MPRGTEEQTQQPGRLARAGRWFTRSFAYAGYERHTLLLTLKSALAATIAWYISYDLMNARSPAFAPFSAVLIMQVTVYRSVVWSLRYVAAVTAGVAVQAALGYLAGPDLATFVLVALIALSIGRWAVLGTQGPHVATAAFFAFSTYVGASDNSTRATQLAQIVVLVLIGCAVGTAVNIALVPPMRYRSAEYGVRALARTLHGLASDIHPVLSDGAPDAQTTGQWRKRAARAGGMITQARSGLETAEESVYYNPRRLLRRHRGHTAFEGYRTVLEALVRTLYQMASLIRSLDQWQEEEKRYDYRRFLDVYAQFLASVAGIAEVLSTLDESSLTQQADRTGDLTEQCEERLRKIVEEAERQALPFTGPGRPYGVLVVEATRLAEECRHTCDTLRRLAGK